MPALVKAAPLPAHAQTTDTKKTEADRLLQQGIQQTQTSQIETALQSLQQALQQYRDLKDQSGEADTLMNLGNAHEALSQYGQAIQLHEQARALYQALGDREGMTNTLTALGKVHESLSQYEKAIKYYDQSLAIARKIGNRQSEGRALGNLGTAYLALGNYTKAIEYHEQSLAIKRATQDRLGEGRVLGDMGTAYLSLGNSDRAIGLYIDSLRIAWEVDDRRGEATSLRNLGKAYEATGKFDRAVESHRKSLAIAQEIGDRRGEGESLINLGVAYRARGKYTEAIEYHERSLEITRAIGDRRGEGSALGNLGMNYYAQGKYTTAIDYHEKRLAIALEINDRQGEGNAMGNLGNAYRAQGNYTKAIEYHKKRLAITRETKEIRGEGQSLGFLGLVYRSLGDYPKSIAYYKQSLAIARKINDRLTIAKSLGYLGNAYHDSGNYDEAIKHHQASLEAAREIDDRRGEGKSLGYLGNAYYAQDKYEDAIKSYQASLEIAREVNDRRGEGKTLGSLGTAYQKLGDYSKAIAHQEAWLAIARKIKDRRGEGTALNNLGIALFKSGNLVAAEKALLDGIEVWESIRQTGVKDDADKVSIFETQTMTYRTLQEVLVAQSKVLPALEIAERGRARAFVELLAQRSVTPENTSQSANPTITPPTLAQIQQIARQQTATLVQYSLLGTETLYIWVIQPTGEITFRQVALTDTDAKPPATPETPTQIATRSIPPIATLRRTLRGANAPSPQRSGGSFTLTSNPGLVQAQLKQLHQLLIAPIADLLPQDPNQKVIFIPQGELFLVPFAALQAANGRYLIEQHTIALAPSIQVLELTHKQKLEQLANAKATRTQLIVGNPVMPKIVFEPGEDPEPLDPLPGAEAEAKALAKLFNTSALIGAEATKAAVKAQMSKASLIHLATHGLLDDENPLNSSLALTPSGSDTGFLTAAELIDMNLQAQLVVLSACDTGRGKITGDGVIGLSRSLISAGVPSVVVSLWKVDDSSTAFLMTQFYKNLEQSGDKAKALRQATLATMQQYKNPFEWAAFTLIGES